jgi:hypothetical protein
MLESRVAFLLRLEPPGRDDPNLVRPEAKKRFAYKICFEKFGSEESPTTFWPPLALNSATEPPSDESN